MRTFYPASLALTCLMLCAFPAQAEVVVIVSTKNSTKSLSIEQVADIFLGKNASFPKGTRATPLDQNETSAARDKFYLQVSGKTSSQMKNIGQRCFLPAVVNPQSSRATVAR